MSVLTQAQVDELVELLTEIEAALRASLDRSREGARPVDLDKPIGRLTRIDELQQQQMTAASRRRDELRLSQVVAARELAARGEYGACARCEEPIALARLRARPETPFCVDCQGRAER